MVNYQPKQGDIIMINLNPTKGHEQSGIRPALIISNDQYFKLTKLLIICPISNNNKKFPLHLELKKLDESIKTTGAIFAEHVRTIDPNVRTIKFKESVSSEVMEEVKNIINLLW